MIVATAGHIDHGKTALIKALTGVDTDRLPEEKKRGITVDLGFAYQRDANGASLGFVDVPGHEKLVRTMLAGATGVDFVILVIAADDGVMPQTREHLAIIDLLGITRGVVVISKIDKVDASRVASVMAEARALVASSVLADADILAVSAQRGDGLGMLKQALSAAAVKTGVRESDGGFRLAVDRTFTLRGVGLVVTGTAHAGRVKPGDRLLLAPQGREVRVRSLRAQDEDATDGGIGQRCALNITSPRVEKADIARGDWIVAPALAMATSRADVHLRLLASESRPLRHWTPVHVHIGSADLSGRIVLLEGAALAPGESTIGQIVLDQPTSALYGDRFVIRDQSAQRTLGGGRVIDPQPPTRHARKPPRLAFLRALDHANPGVALDALIAGTSEGIDLDHFAFVRNLAAARLESLIADRGLAKVPVRGKTLLFAAMRWQELRGQALRLIETHQAEAADSFGATVNEILSKVAIAERAAISAALDALILDKQIVRLGQLLHLPGHTVVLTLDEENIWFEINRVLEAASIDPPRLSVLAERVQLREDEIKPLVEKLGRMGRLRRVAKPYFLLPDVVMRLAEAGRDCAATHPQAILTVGQFREATGISRHATMPLLEYFDRVGFTRRHRDGRRIRSTPETIFGDAADLS